MLFLHWQTAHPGCDLTGDFGIPGACVAPKKPIVPEPSPGDLQAKMDALLNATIADQVAQRKHTAALEALQNAQQNADAAESERAITLDMVRKARKALDDSLASSASTAAASVPI